MLRVGACAPQAILMPIGPSTAVPSLSVVTAAELRVQKPSGTIETWDAVIVSQTATALTVKHMLRSGDLTEPGIYEAKAYLTTPSGVARTEPTTFDVGTEWEI